MMTKEFGIITSDNEYGFYSYKVEEGAFMLDKDGKVVDKWTWYDDPWIDILELIKRLVASGEQWCIDSPDEEMDEIITDQLMITLENNGDDLRFIEELEWRVR